jgi:Ca2+-binding EF-hand superfamily protein
VIASRFDRNKDGVITLEEMREPENEEIPDQTDNPAQRPISIVAVTEEGKDEL